MDSNNKGNGRGPPPGIPTPSSSHTTGGTPQNRENLIYNTQFMKDISLINNNCTQHLTNRISRINQNYQNLRQYQQISKDQLAKLDVDRNYQISQIIEEVEQVREHQIWLIMNNIPHFIPPGLPYNSGLDPGMMRLPTPDPGSYLPPPHPHGVVPSPPQNGNGYKNPSPRENRANNSHPSTDHEEVTEDVDEEVNSTGGVLIYIDNSNILINTKEASAKSLKFRDDITRDDRIRINMKNLLKTALAGRPKIRAVLYGSEPPPAKVYWDTVEQFGIEVQVTQKSGYTNREREVDQNIMLDIGGDLVIHRKHAKHGGTVIIFTGDGGMISAVRRAIEYNWNVEVWAYRGSLAKNYQEELQKSPDKLKIMYLDDYFEEFVFHTWGWIGRIPRERSFVLTFTGLPPERCPEVLETCVKFITEFVGMPMAARYLKHKEDLQETTHLA